MHFRTAQSLGLATDLVITPNHVYRDQLKPEWLAKRGPSIQGQLICPHQPGAREAILKNYDNLFADLAKAGVNLLSAGGERALMGRGQHPLPARAIAGE